MPATATPIGDWLKLDGLYFVSGSMRTPQRELAELPMRSCKDFRQREVVQIKRRSDPGKTHGILNGHKERRGMGITDRLERRNLRSAQAALAKLGRPAEQALAQTVVRPSMDLSSDEFKVRLLPVLKGAVLLATDRGLYLMRGGVLAASIPYVAVEDFRAHGSAIIVDVIKYPRVGSRMRLWLEAERDTGSLPDVVMEQLQSYDDFEFTYARPTGGEGRVLRKAWRPDSPAQVDMSLGGLWSPDEEETSTAVKACLAETERQRRSRASGDLGRTDGDLH